MACFDSVILSLMGREVHISVQELLPIVASCAIWGSEMARYHIRCSYDNAVGVIMINKHTSNNPLAMHLLCCLFFICTKFNIALLLST